MRWVEVRNGSRDTSLGERIRLARRLPERLRGLLFHPPLREGEGLWIEPCNSVHTFFMAYPIDVLLLRPVSPSRGDPVSISEWRVVGIGKCLRPFRAIGIHLGARSVIELPAGTIEKTHTEVGDLLVASFRRREEDPESAAG